MSIGPPDSPKSKKPFRAEFDLFQPQRLTDNHSLSIAVETLEVYVDNVGSIPDIINESIRSMGFLFMLSGTPIAVLSLLELILLQP